METIRNIKLNLSFWLAIILILLNHFLFKSNFLINILAIVLVVCSQELSKVVNRFFKKLTGYLHGL